MRSMRSSASCMAAAAAGATGGRRVGLRARGRCRGSTRGRARRVAGELGARRRLDPSVRPGRAGRLASSAPSAQSPCPPPSRRLPAAWRRRSCTPASCCSALIDDEDADHLVGAAVLQQRVGGLGRERAAFRARDDRTRGDDRRPRALVSLPAGLARPAATAASPVVAWPCDVPLVEADDLLRLAVLEHREVVLGQVHHRALLVANDDVHEDARGRRTELRPGLRRLGLPCADAGRGSDDPQCGEHEGNALTACHRVLRASYGIRAPL